MKLSRMFCAACGLLAVVGCGGGGAGAPSQSGAQLRAVVANYEQTTPVDVYWGDYRFVQDVPAGYLSGYAEVTPGSAAIAFRDDANVVAQSNASITPSSSFTVVNWDSDTGPSAFAVQDSLTTGVGKGKTRLIHAANGVGPVDVYIVPAATDIRGIAPTFTDVQPASATAYTEFAPQYVDVIATTPGTKTVLFSYGQEVTADGVRSLVLTRNAMGNLWSMDLTDK